MSIRTRALIFSTFLGSCVAIGLLMVSLTTNHWIEANPRRENVTEAKGELNFGLFYGFRDLNTGIGTRNQNVDVVNFIRTEHDGNSFWLWLLTTLGTGFGLLSCAIAAIAAVIKAASATKKNGTMAVLLLSNMSAAAAQTVAFLTWLVQFYQYLTHNVLFKADKPWYSEGLAYLGYSFYLVIASTLVVLLNLLILFYVRRKERTPRKGFRLEEDKNQAAIMLY